LLNYTISVEIGSSDLERVKLLELLNSLKIIENYLTNAMADY